MDPQREPGRPLEFQPAEVLESVMRLFWERGYKGTSLQDLESRTGLARSSLYNAFGSKRDLYLRAVAHYQDRLAEAMFAPLEKGRDGLDDIHRFLERLGAGLGRSLGVGPSATGCLMVNGMIEFGGKDAALTVAGDRFSERFLGAMTAALRRAAGHGEIAASTVEAKAKLLLAIAMGINVAARAGVPARERRGLLDAASGQVRAWRRKGASAEG